MEFTENEEFSRRENIFETRDAENLAGYKNHKENLAGWKNAE